MSPGKILLTLALLAAPASAQCMSLGTPGQNGCGPDPTTAPVLACNGTPNVGNAGFQVTGNVSCIVQSPILLLGLCATPPAPINGPFGTNAFCTAGPGGCTAYVDPNVLAVLLGVPNPAGSFTFPLPVPNDPSLIGGKVCAQEVAFCVLFVGVCVAVTNGLSITILP